MALSKLTLIPESSSYGVNFGQSSMSTKLNGGLGRYRKDKIGASSIVDVSWNLDRVGYTQLLAFYNGTVSHGSAQFLVNLVLDTAILAEYKAFFVVGSLKLATQRGFTYIATAQLEVVPGNLDTAGYAALYAAFGADWQEDEDLLNRIVNNEIPDDL